MTTPSPKDKLVEEKQSEFDAMFKLDDYGESTAVQDKVKQFLRAALSEAWDAGRKSPWSPDWHEALRRDTIKKFTADLRTKIEAMSRKHSADCYYLEEGSYLRRHCTCGKFAEDKVIASALSLLEPTPEQKAERFKECYECAAKPGSPTLCAQCLWVRDNYPPAGEEQTKQ